jgi:hypothetical protein
LKDNGKQKEQKEAPIPPEWSIEATNGFACVSTHFSSRPSKNRPLVKESPYCSEKRCAQAKSESTFCCTSGNSRTSRRGLIWYLFCQISSSFSQEKKHDAGRPQRRADAAREIATPNTLALLESFPWANDFLKRKAQATKLVLMKMMQAGGCKFYAACEHAGNQLLVRACGDTVADWVFEFASTGAFEGDHRGDFEHDSLLFNLENDGHKSIAVKWLFEQYGMILDFACNVSPHPSISLLCLTQPNQKC